MNKVLVIGPDKNRSGGIASVTKELSDNQKKIDFSLEFIPISNNFISFIGTLLKIKKCKNQGIAHLNTASRGSFFRKYIISKIVGKKKYIIHLHGGAFQVFYDKSNPIVKEMIKNYFLNSLGVITVSNEFYNFINLTFPDVINLKNIYNGVHPIENLNLPRKNKVIFMGSLDDHKGVSDFIKIAEILEFRYDIEFYIFGSSNERKIIEIQSKIKDKTNITYEGWADTAIKSEVFNTGKVFVNPARLESFGITTVEAMSAGIPVIAYDVGALPEVISEAGIVLKYGDVNGIAESIINIIDDEVLWNQLSKAGKIRATNFNVDHFTSEINEFYKRIM